MHKKPFLPEKTCPVCGRPFVWRKKRRERPLIHVSVGDGISGRNSQAEWIFRRWESSSQWTDPLRNKGACESAWDTDPSSGHCHINDPGDRRRCLNDCE